MMYGDPQQHQHQHQHQPPRQPSLQPPQHHQYQYQYQHHLQVWDFPRGPQQPPPPMMRQPSASSANMGGPPPDYHHPSAPPPPPPYDAHGDSFTAKRMRKIGQRKAVDYTSTVVRYIQIRMWQRDSRDRIVLQPNPAAAIDMLPAVSYSDNPSHKLCGEIYSHISKQNRCSINRVL